VRPVHGGVAVLPRDWTAHARENGAVYRRSPVGDPRLARFLFSMAWDRGVVVPFDEVVHRYGDLAPDAERGPAPEDALLARRLEEPGAPRTGLGLDLACGVGRGVFVLAARLGRAMGIDEAVARVRRARNVATTMDPFLVPRTRRADGPRDVALDLSRLAREGTSFAVGDPARAPVVPGAFDVVVVRRAEDRDAGRRALRAGGLLVDLAAQSDVAAG
jgi:hypothetical protein